MTPITGAQKLETHQTQEVERKLPSFIPDTDGVILSTYSDGHNNFRGVVHHRQASAREFDSKEAATRHHLTPDTHIHDFDSPDSKKRTKVEKDLAEALESDVDIWVNTMEKNATVFIGRKPGFTERIDQQKVDIIKVPKHPYWPEVIKPKNPNTSKLISISRLPGQSDKVIVDLVEPFISRKGNETNANATIVQIEKHTDTVAEVLGPHTDNKPITISTQGFDLAILRPKDPKSINGTVIDIDNKGKYIVLRAISDFDLLVKIPDEIKDFNPQDKTNMVKIREITKFLANSLKNKVQE